jgi:hypothetical protein
MCARYLGGAVELQVQARQLREVNLQLFCGFICGSNLLVSSLPAGNALNKFTPPYPVPGKAEAPSPNGSWQIAGGQPHSNLEFFKCPSIWAAALVIRSRLQFVHRTKQHDTTLQLDIIPAEPP